jgi:hypothetical protein
MGAIGREGLPARTRRGISRGERSTEPTQVTDRQTERRPPQALFEAKECAEFAESLKTPSEV